MSDIEPYFDFIERRGRPWILVIRARAPAEFSPRLSAPGGRMAVLYRRPAEDVVLEGIPPRVQMYLQKARSILTAEVAKDGEAVRIYQTPIENF
ncbi:MAG: hypothetical protein LBB23_02940 [Rickettsiales bacterium]|jgi:hypothetical protein|nr:hypothetical protein [Rickettsiales bacterium]